MITTLLVANRGEIAARIIRSARELGVRTVAVFSDADASLPFVSDADEAVRLAGNAPSDTYLRIDLMLEAARRTGADAIHPGYGFLSERADFARACEAARLLFVGPPATAIELMGSKVAAKQVMAEAGVPILAGATVGPNLASDQVRAAADAIGYPILVKASAGGGGRGMRIVSSPDELSEAVSSAQREAAAAFGDRTVFLEQLVERARHVEVQVLADVHGNVAHLFERECSIQRRHQKVIEEAPSPAVDSALRATMTQAAITAARAVGYVNAGTVEFVLSPDGSFAFLEMNTRLQVEHPVTEMVTGLDLVALQLQIAEGRRLPDEVLHAQIHGHAIEARLYAEDVTAGFLPTSGRIDRLCVPLEDGVRVDGGYGDGLTVSTYYDAMLAKVVAWGPNRSVAASRLSEALQRAVVHGIATNRDLLVNVLRHEAFLSGEFHTGFLEHHGADVTTPPALDPETRRLHALAAAVEGGARQHSLSPLPSGIPPGWRNVGPAHQPVQLESADDLTTVLFRWSRTGLRALIDTVWVDVKVHEIGAQLVDLEVDGRRITYQVQRIDDLTAAGTVVHVDSPLGSSTMLERRRFPLPAQEETAGSLVSPMPGTVVRVDAAEGLHVDVGSPLVVLEAMKMEHTLRSPHAGVVHEIRVTVGSQVDAGTVLVVVHDGEEDTSE